MPISDTDIADFKQRGFKPLFDDQFRPMAPRQFPDVLDRHTIPPVRGQLVDQTKTPLYLLGWPIKDHEFESRYGARCNTRGLSNVRINLRHLWATKYEAYGRYRPDVIHKDFEGQYILAVVGNHSEHHLLQSLDEAFVKAAMEFLEYRDPPKWIRVI